MRFAVRIVCAISIVLVTASFARAWPVERPADHKFTCKEVDVPTRDGLKLKADLYLPDGPGPFPVLVERTPYNKRSCKYAQAIYFSERGYAVLIEDVRGRFRSPGEFTHFLDEGWGQRQDGYDTVEWAGTQSWSDGKVGTTGLSYTCFNQNLTAVTQPPHLKAMFCADSASNWYKDLTYSGGALQQSSLDWQLNRFGEEKTPQEWEEWNHRRIEKHLSYWAAWQPPRLLEYLEHPLYDQWWRNGFAPDEHIEKFTVPVYYMSGWYDRFPHSVTKMFNDIRQRGGSKLARESVKLVIGPWLHGGGPLVMPRVIGDADFGPEAAMQYTALQVRWFDYHLRGVDNGIMKTPPVRIFVMGVNKMRDENEWPIARAVETRYYLSSAHSGTIDSLNDGTLSRQPPADDAADKYEYDPKNPAPSIGGDLFTEPMGPRDHRPADRRSLTFTTAPLPEDMEISGPGSAELYVSSTADDTDFVVTLVDVHPDGYAQILRQNILRASRRESLEKPAPIVPGKVYQLTIPIFPISNVFLKGHRLRLTVSSSSFPRYLPNHNKFSLNNEDAPYLTATNKLYHDGQRPSALVVPVVPAARPAPVGK